MSGYDVLNYELLIVTYVVSNVFFTLFSFFLTPYTIHFRRRRGNSSAKALQQMEDMCKSGDPATAYEALQMYRSRANRHIHKGDKGDSNEYAQALSVSTSGAVNLAENG